MSERHDDDRVRVVDVPDSSRFEIRVDGALAGFADYRRRSDRVVLTHTEVDSAYQGQGLAGRLTREVLDRIRGEGLYVTPLCPYVADYIQQHPEYSDLVDERHRAEVTPE